MGGVLKKHKLNILLPVIIISLKTETRCTVQALVHGAVPCVVLRAHVVCRCVCSYQMC